MTCSYILLRYGLVQIIRLRLGEGARLYSSALFQNPNDVTTIREVSTCQN